MNKRAFNSLKELLFRVFLPFIIVLLYQLPFIMTEYNFFSLLILIQLFGNMLLALVLWESEAFLGITLDLEKIGRIWLYLHYYFKESQKFEVNLYKYPDESITLETLVKIIEGSELLKKEKSQFETEELWNDFLEFKKEYQEWKPKAKTYKIDVYSYYDFSEKWRGFKKLYYINKLGIIGKKIEGNCVALPEKIKVNHRNFTIIISMEGFKNRMLSEELEISQMILKSLTYLSEVEEIPLLKSQLKKKDQLLLKQRKTIDDIDDDYFVANIETEKKSQDSANKIFGKWLKYVFIILLGFIGLIIAFILLLTFGFI